jgi:hypothetical protein
MELKPPPFVLVLPEKISWPEEISNPPSLLPPMTLSFWTYQSKSGLSALKLVRDRVSNSLASEALRGGHNRVRRIMPRESTAECETYILLVVMALKRLYLAIRSEKILINEASALYKKRISGMYTTLGGRVA